jgi:hypothetical protein
LHGEPHQEGDKLGQFVPKVQPQNLPKRVAAPAAPYSLERRNHRMTNRVVPTGRVIPPALHGPARAVMTGLVVEGLLAQDQALYGDEHLEHGGHLGVPARSRPRTKQ